MTFAEKIEEKVAGHYGNPNSKTDMAEDILQKARAKADNPEKLTIADLSAFDELHIGGNKATRHFADRLGITPGAAVLDIGSGLGGPARFIAQTCQCHVTGIDLTPEFCDAGNTLSAAVGLSDSVTLQQGSALALPFADDSFDTVFTIHTGMNIADKGAYYAQAARVLKPGGAFGIYEVMAERDDQDGFLYPVPWAKEPDSSFFITPDLLSECLIQAGFVIEHMEDRRDFALESLAKVLDLIEKQGTSYDRPGYKDALTNLTANIENGFCAPYEFICRQP